MTCHCGTPTSGAHLCERCARTLRHALINVGVYYGDLRTVATRRTRFGTGPATKGSTGKSQPLPVDMRFLDAGPPPEDDKSSRPRPATIAAGTQLRWDTWNTITSWCRTVMEHRPQLYGPSCPTCLHLSCAQIHRRRWPTNTLGTKIEYLARQIQWILAQPWVSELLDELLDIERRLAWFVDRPADRWYAGKCSATDEHGQCLVDLYARVDRGWITCPGCGTRHDVSHRREILLHEAKKYLVTATEAARALIAWTDYDGSETKLVDRIRKWRDREKLEVREVTSLSGKDRHLYRLGDIQELLVSAAQAAQSKCIGAA